jgi:DnaJ-class molecular chaperone
MINVDLTFSESLSGFYKEIPHLDGHLIKLSISEPCRHGDTYAIMGEGMPKFEKPNQFGDLIVQFNVEHPKIALVDENLKSKILESLDTKQLKLSKKNVPHKMMTIEQYKKDAKIKTKSEQMRNQFKKNNGHDHDHDEDFCDEDTDSSDDQGGQQGGPPQCQQS